MRTYIALQGERLDLIFFREYGSFWQDGYASGFNAFCLQNAHLLSKPVLSGGEVVYLPEIQETNNKTDELGI